MGLFLQGDIYSIGDNETLSTLVATFLEAVGRRGAEKASFQFFWRYQSDGLNNSFSQNNQAFRRVNNFPQSPTVSHILEVNKLYAKERHEGRHWDLPQHICWGRAWLLNYFPIWNPLGPRPAIATVPEVNTTRFNPLRPCKKYICPLFRNTVGDQNSQQKTWPHLSFMELNSKFPRYYRNAIHRPTRTSKDANPRSCQMAARLEVNVRPKMIPAPAHDTWEKTFKAKILNESVSTCGISGLDGTKNAVNIATKTMRNFGFKAWITRPSRYPNWTFWWRSLARRHIFDT